MLEIIPNWHPVAVHFAIGLLFTATLLLLIGQALRANDIGNTLMLVGRWNLLLGAIAAAWALLTGWLAYNSVAHDSVAHHAMTVHLRWAIPTVGLFITLAVWFWIQRHNSDPRIVPLALLFIGALALARTGFLGGENVYRYGLGVLSTPASRAMADQEAGPANSRHAIQLEHNPKEGRHHDGEDTNDDHSMPHAH